MMQQHPHELIESFALGDLSRADAETVLEHADECPACAAMLADAMQGVAALAAAEVDRPSTVVRLRRRPAASSVARTRWVAAACAAAAVLLGVWDVQQQVTKPALPIALLVHSHFAHHPLTGVSGNAKVIQSLDGSWVYVVGDGLSPLASYDLWEREPSGAKHVGRFRADLRGEAAAYWTQPASHITGFWILRGSNRVLAWP